ncbi:MAG TPA: hypothetical protein VFT79_08775 [Solirubrobacterales bacterium]|nr:hypothetical protein [Solirubrobacterales bacterium]
MATVIAQEASLSSLLGSMRGEIVDARLGYPDVLHVGIRDRDGDLWRFATQDADWSPNDPADLVGQEMEKADVGDDGELRCRLSGGSDLVVKPSDRGSDEDPPHWELITPGGVMLEFGPGARWQISNADVPAPR